MNYSISYYSETVRREIDSLPLTLRARYTVLTSRMILHGANLGEPHTQVFGDGLFELRLKGSEGMLGYFIAHCLAVVLSCCMALSRKPRKRR
jgi:putative component of toxin-antitoxin plasmid stabilization module